MTTNRISRLIARGAAPNLQRRWRASYQFKVRSGRKEHVNAQGVVTQCDGRMAANESRRGEDVWPSGDLHDAASLYIDLHRFAFPGLLISERERGEWELMRAHLMQLQAHTQPQLK